MQLITNIEKLEKLIKGDINLHIGYRPTIMLLITYTEKLETMH